MKKITYSYRCPNPLLKQAKVLARRTGLRMTDIIADAIHVELRHVKRNGGQVIPPFTIAAMRYEEKYFGSFDARPTMEDKANPSVLF